LTLNTGFRAEGEIDKAEPGQMIGVHVTLDTAPIVAMLKEK
jgi:hypothetical protein